MANRKNTNGAPIKLSDNQIQQIMKSLLLENNCSLPLSNNFVVKAIAKLYGVNINMIIDLIKGRGRFKVLFHTDIHKELVEFFKKKNCENSNNFSSVKKINRLKNNSLSSPEEIKELIELAKNFTLQEVADLYNCSYITIHRRLQPYMKEIKKFRKDTQSIDKKQKKFLSSQEKINIFKAYNGKNIPELAIKFNRCIATIYNVIREMTNKEIDETIPVIDEPVVIEPIANQQDINIVLSIKIDKLLKSVLVNPEFYGETINSINNEFSSLTNQSMSEHEFNSVVVYRVFIILQRVLNINANEMQKIFSKLVGA